jgi:hypothetical protein
MTAAITPAVGRAATAITKRWYELAAASITGDAEAFGLMFAERALTAALSDGDQADALARTLWHLHRTAAGWGTTPEAFENVTSSRERENWRAVADGLRMTLTGSGS